MAGERWRTADGRSIDPSALRYEGESRGCRDCKWFGRRGIWWSGRDVCTHPASNRSWLHALRTCNMADRDLTTGWARKLVDGCGPWALHFVPRES